jgi:diguanylate cyclase (GGDEF)-like protein
MKPSKCTILIVDDEKANLLVLNQILSDGYRIVTAKSGKTALKLAVKEKPDIILLDIILPDINGFDVLTKLKNDSGTKNIPVICITGLDNENYEKKAFMLGAVDYIIKPFKIALVKARVRAHLEIIRQMHTIEKLGLTDPLTNIPNRRSFDDRIDMEWRRAMREKSEISFLMIDIDHFKNYNDTYGHPQGDAMLKEVAGILTLRGKRPADLPVRLGGEEFGLLLPDTALPAAVSIAESIRADVEALRVPCADGSIITSATISIGVVAMIPKKNDSLKDFLARADENLYRAKTAGRNQVYAGARTRPDT